MEGAWVSTVLGVEMSVGVTKVILSMLDRGASTVGVLRRECGIEGGVLVSLSESARVELISGG